MKNLLLKIIIFLESWVNKISISKYPIAYTLVISSAISIFCCFPKYDYINQNDQDGILLGVSQQISNPFKPIDIKAIMTKQPQIGLGEISHLDKRAFRITTPIIAHVLSLTIFTLPIFQQIITVLFILSIILFFRVSFSDKKLGICIGLYFATLPIVQFGFYDWITYDVTGWLTLMICLFNFHPALKIPIFLVGFFNDERVFLVAPMIILIFYQLYKDKTKLYYHIISLIFAMASYLLIRYQLGQELGLTTGQSMIGIDILRKNIFILPLTLFLSYKTGAIFMVFMGIILFYQKKVLPLFVSIALFSLNIIAALFVLDLGRSLMYGFLMLIFSLIIFITYEKRENSYKYILAFTLINLCFPMYLVVAYNPFALTPFIRYFIPNN